MRGVFSLILVWELDCGSSHGMFPLPLFLSLRFRSPVGLRGSLVWRENEKKKGKKRKEKREGKRKGRGEEKTQT